MGIPVVDWFKPGEYVAVDHHKRDVCGTLLPMYLWYENFKVVRYDPVNGQDCFLLRSGDNRDFCFNVNAINKIV